MSSGTKLLFCLLSLSIVGCSDYNLHKKPEEPVPEIDVTPIDHDFGALNAGSETRSITVTVQNVGTGDLDVYNTSLQNGAANFTITETFTGTIVPGGSEAIVVEYTPGTYESNTDVLAINSNDSDESTVLVPLGGSGDAPVIIVDPEYYDFGALEVGCDDYLPLTVTNVGNADLILSDIVFFASVPVDLLLYDYEMYWGPLPIVIPPGDVINLEIDYTPLDGLDDAAYLEIESNDPETPLAVAVQEGLGDYGSWKTDSFEQNETVDVDILFVVDNSGSMSSNQTNLKNNFSSFISAFSGSGVSYQIAVITTDNSSFVGPVIDSSNPDPTAEFNNQIDSIGTSGSPHEKGLRYAYESTTTGDAAPGAGFQRPDARLVVVYVSDEPDHSSTGMTYTDYADSLKSLKSSLDLIVAHAIAGDYPSGCSGNGSAQYGEGYYEVVSQLAGTFMSICASDWSVTMDTLARDSIMSNGFTLTGNAIPDSIEVYVDGVLDTSWVYDEATRTVLLTSPPAEGSTVDITYALWGCS